MTAQLQARMQEALHYHQRGDLAAARLLYEEILQAMPDHADALHLLGVIAHQQQEYEVAVACIAKAIGLFPRNPVFHNNLGMALRMLGRFDEALACYDEALNIDPAYHKAYLSRGRTLREIGRTREAVAAYDQAIRLSPGYAEAYNSRGVALRELNRLDEAVAAYDQAIRLRPDYAGAHYNRGNALMELTRHDEAVAAYDQAIRLRPDYAGAHYNRGNALQKLDRPDEAIEAFDEAIRLRPDDPEAYHSRGNALQKAARFAEALESYDQAIRAGADDALIYFNRGIALQESQRNLEAVESYDLAIRRTPDYHEAHLNRGNALKDLCHPDKAIESYDLAIRCRPDDSAAYWNKSLALLMRGDFREGWALHEWRKKNPSCSAIIAFTQPLWLGEEPLAGKTILLYSEQGLGDTLQFCRYAKPVAELGARVLLLVEPSLTRLLGRLDGVEQVIAMGEPLPDFDYQCPLMSLPLAFGTTLETVPAPASYLSAEQEEAGRFGKLLGTATRPRVGVAWNGGHRQHQPELWRVNARRNIPFDKIARLREADIDFVSLQKGEPAESELLASKAQLWPESNLLLLADELTDFAATAALVENLDLVIAVDTSTAHLAAAMGKPVWLLNRYDTCWRWLLDREDSPWYPSMKIYRQPSPGDWDSVIKRVFDDLLHLTPLTS